MPSSNVRNGQQYRCTDRNSTVWQVLAVYSDPNGILHAQLCKAERPYELKTLCCSARQPAMLLPPVGCFGRRRWLGPERRGFSFANQESPQGVIMAPMKPALIACGVFLVGLILLAAMSNADFVPSGVRSVLNSVANIW